MPTLWKAISVLTLAAVIIVAVVVATNLAPANKANVVAAAPGNGAGAPGITVSASGTAKAKPDVAYVNLGVQTTATTAKEALGKNNQAMAALIAKLESLGIAKNDMQTGSLNVYPRTNPSRDGTAPAEITGYWANNSLNITIRDLAKAGDILDAAVAAGANSLGGVRFGLLDDSKLRADALREAIKAARPKADVIAEGLGLKVTSVVSVVEQGSSGAVPMMEAAALAKGAGGVPIESGELTVTASVQVTFGF